VDEGLKWGGSERGLFTEFQFSPLVSLARLCASSVAASLLDLNRQKQMNRAIRFSAIVHGSVLQSPDCITVRGAVVLERTSAHMLLLPMISMMMMPWL
jgi:hypothetical protein